MQKQIEKLIFEALKNVGDELENENLKNPNLETKIYGTGGELDSLSLVSFIADLEQMLSSLGIDIVLADERTMSARNSPFKDVATLTQYILNRGQENG
ncbi:hypothetical protein OQH60_07315 [Campylobacter sp. MIT 21-1685]|uniref:hypothetical protein n=1 Tax=unclassified Campylobacter TaxID=2593542 RepID=UPI00224B5276|nr:MULTISPECIES: hypothetical protein [unclassified Campylobacter]MCX2683647.1 hypothetical protein [Campylobacter sp. MIT 21-1684]MCX2751953.1 hypothetical protein [Campylobacter sp. MIT 21-1682]MCX2808153.1 hypothetical protein [Campylobacter sp. MIT 21-1685]